jgi:hypothetical protein
MGVVRWVMRTPYFGPRVMSTTSHEAPGCSMTQINSAPKALWDIMFDGAGSVKRSGIAAAGATWP